MAERDSKDQPACRICLQENETILKLPCKCKGSLSFIHEKCLSDYLRTKQQDASAASTEEFRKNLKCQICKESLDVAISQEYKWERLLDIQMGLYLILVVICCLSLVGLQLAEKLVHDAFQTNSGYIQKFVYLFAYIWLMGIILYLLCEPILSEVKQNKFIIKATGHPASAPLAPLE